MSRAPQARSASGDPPHQVKTLLHYANARPSEDTWRRIVLGPVAKIVLAPKAAPPQLPTFGINSLSELMPILGEFRDVLERWTKLESAYSNAAENLLQTVIDRSRLEFAGWELGVDSGRVIEQWKTKDDTFSEFLYATLLLVLKEVPYRSIHLCAACGTFFYDPSNRTVKFCSKTCQNREMARRFRERAETKSRLPKKPSNRPGQRKQGGPA